MPKDAAEAASSEKPTPLQSKEASNENLPRTQPTFAMTATLLVDDTDEDATELLTVICDGDPRTNRGFDFDAYRNGGVA